MGWPNNLDIIFFKNSVSATCFDIYATCFVYNHAKMCLTINKLIFDPSFIILLLFVVVVVRKKYNGAYLEVLIGLYFVINASVLNYFVYLMRILPFMVWMEERRICEFAYMYFFFHFCWQTAHAPKCSHVLL